MSKNSQIDKSSHELMIKNNHKLLSYMMYLVLIKLGCIIVNMLLGSKWHVL